MASTRTTLRTGRRREHTAMALHAVQVSASRRISPQMVRITLTGPTLADFVDDGPDQRCKLFLPRVGRQAMPAVSGGADWYQSWRSLPEQVRPVMRTYTIRRSRPERSEVDIDFVLHGSDGPASVWAARAQVGDKVALYGPRADYAPAAGCDWQLLIGDASAVPAITSIVEAAAVTARLVVLLEVDSPAEEMSLASCAEASVTWLHLCGRPPGRTGLLLEALHELRFPNGRVSAWIAGEAAMVRSARRHLVCERGIAASDVHFTGYWRLGTSIDPD